MFDAKGIGRRIREARESAGYSKAALETPLSISRQTLTAWEKGDRAPGVDDLTKLCSLLHCDFGYLVGEYEEKTRPVTDVKMETGLSPEAIEILRIFKEYCPGEELRIISNMICYTVNDSLVKEFAEIGEEAGNIANMSFFQALNNLLFQFRLLPMTKAEKAGYIVIFQKLFTDFIEDQLQIPLKEETEKET